MRFKYGDVVRIRPGSVSPSEIMLMVICCDDPESSWALVMQADPRGPSDSLMPVLFPLGEVTQFNPEYEEWEILP